MTMFSNEWLNKCYKGQLTLRFSSRLVVLIRQRNRTIQNTFPGVALLFTKQNIVIANRKSVDSKNIYNNDSYFTNYHKVKPHLDNGTFNVIAVITYSNKVIFNKDDFSFILRIILSRLGRQVCLTKYNMTSL
jgi:prenyltransferase beta subunit